MRYFSDPNMPRRLLAICVLSPPPVKPFSRDRKGGKKEGKKEGKKDGRIGLRYCFRCVSLARCQSSINQMRSSCGMRARVGDFRREDVVSLVLGRVRLNRTAMVRNNVFFQSRETNAGQRRRTRAIPCWILTVSSRLVFAVVSKQLG